MDNLSPEQIQQMIAMLQNMLPSNNEEPAEEEKSSSSPIRTVDRKPKPSTVNKFDQMMEANLHKEDIEIDKKLAKYDPTPRVRRFQPLDVVCRVCGKRESVSPNLLSDSPDRYKCNNCSRGAG